MSTCPCGLQYCPGCRHGGWLSRHPARAADFGKVTLDVRDGLTGFKVTSHPADGFLLPPGLADDLMATIRDNLASWDAYYDKVFRDRKGLPSRKLTLRKRVRWHAGIARGRAAARLFRLVAGHDLPGGGDW